jgi:hypothetical protein
MVKYTPSLHKKLRKVALLFEIIYKRLDLSYVLEFTKCAIQDRTILFSFFYPKGKAGGIQIRRCQGIAVKCYGGTLGALALNPSGF